MDIKARKENAYELRRTHFSFGNEPKNFQTEYKKEYTPFGFNASSAVTTNQALRKTNLILGDYPVNYVSTINDQNKAIEKHNYNDKVINMKEVKKDLTKSHFSLGNDNEPLKSMAHTEFIDKSKLSKAINEDNQGKVLRQHHYILGNYQPDYLSQTKITYTPKKAENTSKAYQEEKKLDLQKNHYSFGFYKEPVNNSMNQINYFPKALEKSTNNQQLSRELRKTNFILGEDNPDYLSVNADTYIPHAFDKKNREDQIKLSKDLRNHHFSYGNDQPSLTTIHKEEYKNLPIDPNSSKDNQNNYLRTHHFSIGDKNEPLNIYQTSYNETIGVPKNLPEKNKIDNNSFKTTYLIKDQGKQDYYTESRGNYTKKDAPFSEQEKAFLREKIKEKKSNHFGFGDDPSDMKTTNNLNFIFNNSYIGAKTVLNEELKKDLRATHYQLGYTHLPIQSTHETSYVPLPYAKNTFNKELMNDLKTNHFDFKGDEKDPNNEKSIYMLDYEKK